VKNWIKFEIGNQLVRNTCVFGCGCGLCKFLLFDLNINCNYLKIAIVLFCREKKKREERVGSQKANEAITKCTGDFLYSGH